MTRKNDMHPKSQTLLGCIFMPRNKRLKVVMYYGEKFESVNAIIERLNKYIYYYKQRTYLYKIYVKLLGLLQLQ